jgi:hypothetical protein
MSTPQYQVRSSYSELLRHPNWQRKRLEVMERAQFQCEACGDNSTTLNVHHSYYEKGAMPWDYPLDSLHCYCQPCHQENHDWASQISRHVGGMNKADAAFVLGVCVAIKAVRNRDLVLNLEDENVCSGVGTFLSIGIGRMKASLADGKISGHGLVELFGVVRDEEAAALKGK